MRLKHRLIMFALILIGILCFYPPQFGSAQPQPEAILKLKEDSLTSVLQRESANLTQSVKILSNQQNIIKLQNQLHEQSIDSAQ